jgi:hypothetical protein
MGSTPDTKSKDIPDLLPKRESKTDVISSHVRRTDPSQCMPLDSLPPWRKQRRSTKAVLVLRNRKRAPRARSPGPAMTPPLGLHVDRILKGAKPATCRSNGRTNTRSSSTPRP